MRTGANKGIGVVLDEAVDRLDRLDRRGRMLPVPITNLLATANIKTRGPQVSFRIASLQGIDSFVLLRNFSQDVGSAQIVAIWSRASLLTTPQIFPIVVSYSDSDQSIAGQKAYYWLKVVPASTKTAVNVFVSGPQIFDATQFPSSEKITQDYSVNQPFTPTTQPLTGTTGGLLNHARVDIASFQVQYPFGLVTYNSGSITPLLDATTYYIYCDDSTQRGGAQTYIASTSNPIVTAGLHRLFLGSITTPVFGGGGTGGKGGGNGGCFSPETKIWTPRGDIAIAEIVGFSDVVHSLAGWRMVLTVLAHEYDGPLLEMPCSGLVTPGHRLRWGREWLRADKFFRREVHFQGLVYNLSVEGETDDEHSFRLANGYTAHNVFKA